MNHHAVNLRWRGLEQSQRSSLGLSKRERTLQHGGHDHSDDQFNGTDLPKSPLYRPLQFNGCSSNDRPKAYPRRRRVTFASRIRIKEVQHWAEMPTEILEAMWLTPKEYTVIKDIPKQTVRLIMAGQIIDKDPRFEGLSSRGLETRTREGQESRNQRRSYCRQAVLMEQAHQRQMGTYSLERISTVSLVQSTRCIIDAQTKAVQDAVEARRYHLSPTPTSFQQKHE